MSRIHFSHHLCLAHGGRIAPDAMFTEYQKIFHCAVGDRRPESYGCSATGNNANYTTSFDRITCKFCRSDLLATNTKRAWDKFKEQQPGRGLGAWQSDSSLVARAWFLCCRHQGVPSPFPTSEVEGAYVRAIRAMVVVDTITPFALMSIQHPSPLLPRLLAAIEQLEPDERAALASYIEEVKRTDASIARAAKHFSRLNDIAQIVAHQIQNPKSPKEQKGLPTPKLTEVVSDLARLAGRRAA